MTRAVATALTEARSLIAKPGKWCQGHFAVNAKGEGVGENDPTAVAFCMVGAIGCTVGSDDEAYREVRDALGAAAGTYVLTTFNDTHTKEEVLGVFDKAIESVEVPA